MEKNSLMLHVLRDGLVLGLGRVGLSGCKPCINDNHDTLVSIHKGGIHPAVAAAALLWSSWNATGGMNSALR